MHLSPWILTIITIFTIFTNVFTASKHTVTTLHSVIHLCNHLSNQHTKSYLSTMHLHRHSA